MSDELPDVPSLRVVVPPPGGLEHPRVAIAADGERTATRRRWMFAAAPIAAVVLLVLWTRRDSEPPAIEVAPPVALADPAIAPTFYWVASRPGPAPAAPQAGVSFVEIDQVQPISRLELR